MPSFADSAVIFVLALILFGPKKLPQLARQLGRLMGEFRRASNDFRMQMEEELRITEQEENQKKIETNATIETFPVDPEHPHIEPEGSFEPIAESGNLKMMPPSSGFPEPTGWAKNAPATSNAGLVATEDHTVTAPDNTELSEEGEPDLLHG